jgi:hypothetical protein
MTWLLTTLATLVAAFYIAAPFYREASLRAPAGAPLRARQRELETRREGLLRELKELELDRRMGKVDADQYAQSRARATQEASLVLRQLEALISPTAPREKASTRTSPSLNKHHNVASRSVARLDLEVELEIAVARARRQKSVHSQKATWSCDCGRVMQDSDLFCASCGRAKTVVPAEYAQTRAQTQTAL